MLKERAIHRGDERATVEEEPIELEQANVLEKPIIVERAIEYEKPIETERAKTGVDKRDELRPSVIKCLSI